MKASEKYEIFADRLKHALELRGMTQYQLAKKLGVMPAIVNNYVCCRREASLANIRKIAIELSVSSYYLLGLSDEPEFRGPAADELTTLVAGLSKRDLETVITLVKSLSSSRKE